VDEAHDRAAHEEELGSDTARGELGIEALEGSEEGGAVEEHWGLGRV
jgi:hypothetical protein